MKKQLESLIKEQTDKCEWNFYNEREHVENLFYSRFNFFLVFYGMLIAAIVTILSSSTEIKDSIIVLGILIFGILVLLLMQYTLCNVHHTLQIILKLIDGLSPYHSSPIISSLRCRGNTGIIIAFVIPSLCIAFLFLVLYHCIENYRCEVTTCFFLFLGSIIFFCLFNLDTAIQHISDIELKNIIEKASNSLESSKLLEPECRVCTCKRLEKFFITFTLQTKDNGNTTT